ncbi:MAG: NUDIX hydrolase [Candidatus Thorarchaeota archaeon]
MTKEGKFIFCVAATIENPQGEILLVKRSPGNFPEKIWDVVGGKVESLENPFDALLREIKEETGIDEIKIIKAINDFYWFTSESSSYIIGMNFWCKTKQLNVQLSDEHIEYKWCQLDEALKISTHQTVIRCIEKFIVEKKRLELLK